MSDFLRERTLFLKPGIVESAIMCPARTDPRAEERRPGHLRWLWMFDPRLAVPEIQVLTGPANRNAKQVRIVANIRLSLGAHGNNDPFHGGVVPFRKLRLDGAGVKRAAINF